MSPDVPLIVEELRLAYRVPRRRARAGPAAPAADRAGRRSRRSPTARETSHRASSARRRSTWWRPPCARPVGEAAREGRTALIAPAELVAELEPLGPRPGTAFDELAAPVQALSPSAGEGARVRPRRPRRAGRGSSPRPTGVEGLRALYVASDAGDEDARRRARRSATGGAGAALRAEARGTARRRPPARCPRSARRGPS